TLSAAAAIAAFIVSIWITPEVGGPASMSRGPYDRVKSATGGHFGSIVLSFGIDRDRSSTAAPALSTCDCRLRRKKRPRMLAIQKIRIGLRQPAATMNHPIKLTRLPKVSALPALTQAVLPARSGDKREHAVAKTVRVGDRRARAHD